MVKVCRPEDCTVSSLFISTDMHYLAGDSTQQSTAASDSLWIQSRAPSPDVISFLRPASLTQDPAIDGSMQKRGLLLVGLEAVSGFTAAHELLVGEPASWDVDTYPTACSRPPPLVPRSPPTRCTGYTCCQYRDRMWVDPEGRGRRAGVSQSPTYVLMG